MCTIKLKKAKHEDWCYFFDAGDIEIIPSKGWYGITVKRKNGLPLFESAMNPAYVEAFGAVHGEILDQEAFELPSEVKFKDVLFKNVSCFDPRVVASVVFMLLLRHKVFENGKKINDIALPVLSVEEAKEFLKKNNLLREDPESDWTPNPPNELVGIPDEVKKLLE